MLLIPQLTHAEEDSKNEDLKSIEMLGEVYGEYFEVDNNYTLSSSGFQAGSVVVTTDSMNLRWGPGTGYAVRSVLSANTYAEIIPHSNNGISANGFIWWYVEVFDSGLRGWLAQTSRLVIVNPPNPPVLTSPANGATNVSTRPTFRWQSVANADDYVLMIAADYLGQAGIVKETTGTSFTLSSSDELDEGELHVWTVVARNKAGVSNIGETRSFTTEEIEPAYFEVEIIYYDNKVEVGDVVEVDGRITNTGGQWATQTIHFYFQTSHYSRSVTLNPGEQRVITFYHTATVNNIGYNAICLESMHDEHAISRAVEVVEPLSPPDLPNLISPADGALDVSTRPTFQWESVANADLYTLAILADYLDEPMLLHTTSTSLTLPADKALQNDQAHGWMVLAKNDAGYGDVISVDDLWFFRTKKAEPTEPPPPPKLVSPAHLLTNVSTRPTFQWQASAGADDYVLIIASDYHGDEGLVIETSNTSYTLSASEELQSGKVHGWIVVARNSVGVSGVDEYRGFATYQPVPADQLRVSNTNGLGLRLREAPGLASDIITVIPEGSVVSVLGGSQQLHGYNWLEIEYSGMVGWAADDYLFEPETYRPKEPSGLKQYSIESVPVAAGGTITENRLVLAGEVESIDGENLKLQVEHRAVGTSFSQSTGESAMVESGAEAAVTISGLSSGSYHWRARTVSASGMTSDWVLFSPGTASFTVNYFQQPTAVINLSSDHVVENDPIWFDASSSHPLAEIVSYHWNMGNGFTATDKNHSYLYPQSGTYTVTLTVTTAGGLQHSASREVEVLSRLLVEAINNFVARAIAHQQAIYSTSTGLASATGYFQGNVRRTDAQRSLDMAEKLTSAVTPFYLQLLVEGAGLGKDIVLRRIYEDNQSISSIYLPVYADKLGEYETDLIAHRNELLANIGSLSQAQVDEIIARLNAINLGLVERGLYYLNKSSYLVKFAAVKEDDLSSWQWNVGSRAFSYSVSGLIYLHGGPIKYLLAAGSSTAGVLSGLAQSFANQEANTVLMNIGLQGLEDGLHQLELISRSAHHGLDVVEQIANSQSLPALYAGDIVRVEHVCDGVRAGSNYFFARNAFSKVTIKNTGQRITEYHLYAKYDQRIHTTQLFPFRLPGGVAEMNYDIPVISDHETISLVPGGEVSLLIYYMKDGSGNIPRKQIDFTLVAVENEQHMFRLDRASSKFGTTLIEDGVELTEQEGAGLDVLNYPVHSEIHPYIEDGNIEPDTYLLRLKVNNPFYDKAILNLVQEMPAGIDILSYQDGLHYAGNIYWDLEIEPEEYRILEVRFSMPAGSTWPHFAQAQLSYYHRMEDQWLSYSGAVQENHPQIADQELDAAVRAALDITAEYLTFPALASITELNAEHSNISSLFGLEGAQGLSSFNISGNTVQSIYPLGNLLNLTYLDLSSNLITDLGPLVENCDAGGLGAGDYVNLTGNPLDLSDSSQALSDIYYLEAAGVMVDYGDEPGTDAALSALTVSEGSLEPPFESGEFEYTVYVAHDVASIEITANLSDVKAAMTIDGAQADSGEAEMVDLGPAGSATEIKIEVTAGDGEAQNIYKIVVHRIENNYDYSITLGEGWNLLSAPRWARVIYFDEGKVDGCLSFKDGVWQNGTLEELKNPSHAIFVKMAEQANVHFLWDEMRPENEFAGQQLTGGWNLISSGLQADYLTILAGLHDEGEGGLTQIFAPNSYNGNKQEGYHLLWESTLIGLLHPGEDIHADMFPFDGYWVYLRGPEIIYSTPVGNYEIQN